MESVLRLASHRQAQELFGPHDRQIKALARQFKVKFSLRGDELVISGSRKGVVGALVHVQELLSGAGRQAAAQQSEPQRQRFSKPAALPAVGPKTKGQREYTEAIRRHDIVFGVGPAGTGKTYLAMAAAVEALKNARVRRIILTRPAIEAGESLGYLPGDMIEKISPYLRPLYDALYDMMEAERIEKYIETGIIEVAPLAYMRGRTLNEAFIILDEAQNATPEQMKMFLTRLGFDSRAVITGDITQSDLPDGKPAGLLQAMELLRDIEGIKFVFFSGADVVRHELVQKIIKAYEKVS